MGGVTIHAGGQGDHTPVYIQWCDHNILSHEIRLEVAVLNQDKPRVVELRRYLGDSDNYVVLLTTEEG